MDIVAEDESQAGESGNSIKITFPRRLFQQKVYVVGYEAFQEFLHDYEGEESMFDPELKSKVQTYINCFRNEIGQYLHKSIGQQFNIVGFPSGVIIEIKQGPDVSNMDSFKGKVTEIGKAFNRLGRRLENYFEGEKLAAHQQAFNQNKRYVQDGTELLFGNGIVIIAGNEDRFWTESNARADVKEIVDHMLARQKEMNSTPKSK